MSPYARSIILCVSFGVLAFDIGYNVIGTCCALVGAVFGFRALRSTYQK